MQITEHRGHRDTSGDRSAQEQQHLFIDPRVAPGAFIHYSKLHIIIDGFSIIIFLKKKNIFTCLRCWFLLLSVPKEKSSRACLVSFRLFTHIWVLSFFFVLLLLFSPFTDHTLCNGTERQWTVRALSMTVWNLARLNNNQTREKKRDGHGILKGREFYKRKNKYKNK